LRSEKEKKQMDVEQRVKKVVAKHLKTDEDKIKLESDFVKDLGAESIQSIELVAAFEEEFDIEMDEQAALAVKAVGDAVEFIKKVIEEGGEKVQ
jgi:acyl carrier protein